MQLEQFKVSGFPLFYPTGTTPHRWGCNAELWLLDLSSLVQGFLVLQSWTDIPVYPLSVRSLREVFLILLGLTSNAYSWVWPLQRGSEKFLAASFHTIGATAVQFLQDRTITFPTPTNKYMSFSFTTPLPWGRSQDRGGKSIYRVKRGLNLLEVWVLSLYFVPPLPDHGPCPKNSAPKSFPSLYELD